MPPDAPSPVVPPVDPATPPVVPAASKEPKPAVVPPVTPPPTGGASVEPKQPRVLGDNDEPTAGELVTLSSDAFKKRIDRGTKKQLEAEFGTSDPAVLKAKLSRLTELEGQEEARTRASMTEQERLRADLDAANQRVEAAEARTRQVETDHLITQDENALRAVATEYVAPKYWRVVQADLATHLYDEYGETRLEAMTEQERDQAVKKFFTDYVKENPELARAKPPAGGEPPPPPAVVQRPLTNGTANPRGRADPKPAANVITTGQFAGKTAAPGRPNSMTPAEYAQWKRQTGNNY